MNLAQRKRLFNRCDPRDPLEPEDPRNVDVDGGDGSVRGRRWLDALAAPIELGERPVTTLFTGQSGSGVTTELLRLAGRLRDSAGANLLAVRIDAAESIDLYSPIDVPEVLLAVLERTGAAVATAEGEPGADPLRRFRGWLADLPAASGPDAPMASIIVRTNPTLRAAFRARVNADLSRFLSDVRSELVLLDNRARRLGRGGIVVLFDSLDRLRGASKHRQDVLTSAEHLFERDLSYLELPIHVVYTVPAALVFRVAAPLHFLPQIALSDRRGQRSAAGFVAGRGIVEQRLSDAKATAEEVFGPQAEERIDRLIAWSAGSPGAIVRLLQNVVAEPSLDAQLFERVLSMGGDEHRRAVPAGAYPWLARVHVEKTLPVDTEEERELAEQMLSNGVVVGYRDDAAWFDVHPAAQRIPGIAEAIARREGRP